MKTFKLEFDCDNAAFDVFPEQAIADILRNVAESLERKGAFANDAQWIFDLNGNRIGTFKFSDRDRLRMDAR